MRRSRPIFTTFECHITRRQKKLENIEENFSADQGLIRAF